MHSEALRSQMFACARMCAAGWADTVQRRRTESGANPQQAYSQKRTPESLGCQVREKGHRIGVHVHVPQRCGSEDAAAAENAIASA